MRQLAVQVRELQDPASVYRQCMRLMTRLAAKGLVHCDFNEFNLLVRLLLSCRSALPCPGQKDRLLLCSDR